MNVLQPPNRWYNFAPMEHTTKIAQELNIRPIQVQKTIELFDAGNTIPFVARYRKEATGELDEVQLRAIYDRLEKLRALDERRQTVLTAIEEQGKLTPELAQKIAQAETMTALEDLYQPYKKKRQTRADVARQRGLQPLADLILKQERGRFDLQQLAQAYLTADVPDVASAWAGARDIVAEAISDQAEVRGEVREKGLQWGTVGASKVKDAEDPKLVYQDYYEFTIRVDRLRPHQILALNRGEAEKVLKIALEIPERDWLKIVASHFLPRQQSPFFEQLDAAIRDGAERLLLPAIERDIRRMLTEKAELHAIQVFADNLRALLNQPPLAGQVVLGIDPGFRTGCKLAVVDATGKLLETAGMYPHEPQKEWSKALATLTRLVQTHKVTLIAIGNGTASRETEKLVAELIQQGNFTRPVHYLMVNEAGASVYSASELAGQELSELDVTLRGAVSIGRRIQDPLAELVKIDPKSIGVGLYQHDVNQKELAQALDGVVESVVNQVGVDLNSASPALLTYVAGIGPKVAQNIVKYRQDNGPFPDRTTLKKVAGIGPKAFEQAAGFLRVRGGPNPLDGSAIHPESYALAQAVLKKVGLTMNHSLEEREKALIPLQSQIPALAQELKCGEPTLKDILMQLVRPGRDPREDLPTPILRQDVLSLDDLREGMVLSGTVRNVVDFGAFVDIGVKQDGLIHRKQIPAGQTLRVGDVIQVSILSIDKERGRIGLAGAG